MPATISPLYGAWPGSSPGGGIPLVGADNLLNPENLMTHVILTRFGDERTVTIPTQQNFQDFLKVIRTLEPDRRWQISESWEVQA
jgi:hypothetical protein